LKKSLEEALSPSKSDYYLLVDNMIPDIIPLLVEFLLFYDVFWKNLVDRNKDLVKNIISDVENLLNVWYRRGNASYLESCYAFGLVSIASKAIKLSWEVSEKDASTILKAACIGLSVGVSKHNTIFILSLFEPLSIKAPQHYINLLEILSQETNLSMNEVYSIYNMLNNILSNYSNKLKGLVWPLENIVSTYSELLSGYPYYFDDKIEGIAEEMCNWLSELRRNSPELATIAKAHILIPPLIHGYVVEDYVKKHCSINNIIDEVSDVLKNLEDIVNRTSELVNDKIFMEWIKTKTFDLTENGVRRFIMNSEASLKFYLARYELNDGKLDEAKKLYSEAAKIHESIGAVSNYLLAHGLILSTDVIKANSFNEYIEVAKGFEDLWNKTLENLEFLPHYLEVSSGILGDYLVYLASRGKHNDVENLLNKHIPLLNYHEKASVLTKLMLRILGYKKIEISFREIISTYIDSIFSWCLPALKLILGVEADVEEECARLEYDPRQLCEDAFLAIKGNEVAAERLKKWALRRWGLEFYKLVEDLNGKLLVQLLAFRTSDAMFAFILYSLINGNMDLARRCLLGGSIVYRVRGRLFSRLFREAHDSCCDVSDEKFKLALLKLFYYHF
jgi:hypothetical protein